MNTSDPTTLIHSKRVVARLKETRTDWPDLKAWFSARKAVPTFAPGDVAEQGSVSFAMWCMQTTSVPETTARSIAASFAWGADQRLVEAYEAKTKGCRLVREATEALMSWCEDPGFVAEAGKMRWRVSENALKAKGGVSDILYSIGSAFAPSAWGGAGLAHEQALSAAAGLLTKSTTPKDEKALVMEREAAYQVEVVRSLLA